MNLTIHKTGLIVGLFLGGWHLIWSFLVLTGIGQVLIDFVLWAHMVHLPYVVGPFEFTAALMLIIMTTFVGYVLGAAFAWAWNRIHR
ncbi:hypothetical protein A2765_04245 [Candidatus Kaiserbacteria bacterium RIFCSPHIGHO2_01_FULL_56_24]|uniref:Uncharacterized protein n=1 Tax=Candidatus Kaiserbacteria bacterium RIFCSPHIGHO2_01_FULL_56_24 TaxID=1798487 RepID=A0A1F6DEM4_9BACT|nr:MAG: hypothetical protein A2765_04245 [Candidatus Kaiserbacteria bacterium RIFCSPHIGHO2_01_FULL_56_24]